MLPLPLEGAGSPQSAVVAPCGGALVNLCNAVALAGNTVPLTWPHALTRGLVGWPVMVSQPPQPWLCSAASAGSGKTHWTGWGIGGAGVAKGVCWGLIQPLSWGCWSSTSSLPGLEFWGGLCRAAVGTENFVQKSCMRCSGLHLSADGRQQDQVDCENGAQVSRSGALRRSLVLGDDLQLRSGVQVDPPHCRPVLGVWPAALSPAPEAVEGMPQVSAACFTRHDGHRGVLRLVWGRGVGPSGRAALARSMESTVSRFQWHSSGCGVIRNW